MSIESVFALMIVLIAAALAVYAILHDYFDYREPRVNYFDELYKGDPIRVKLRSSSLTLLGHVKHRGTASLFVSLYGPDDINPRMYELFWCAKGRFELFNTLPVDIDLESSLPNTRCKVYKRKGA